MHLRLATRTGLAAFAAATISMALLGVLFRDQISRVLRERVDRQLEERSASAPILAAVGDRVARSELNRAVEGARVVTAEGIVEVGPLPDGDLPPVTGTGFSTASADGEEWRLYTVAVADVPEVGDQTLVQLVAPLGDVDEQASTLRRRGVLVAVLAALAAGGFGYLLGALASRPLTALRRDTERLGDAEPGAWRVRDDYGPPEVDDVAATLNTNLERLARETERRGEALASARAFAASAAHELRTPLQGALTNLDIARSDRVDETDRTELVGVAHDQLQRMAAALGAVRALADAELADPSWFEEVDLAELVDSVVADEGRRAPEASIAVDAEHAGVTMAWRDGVRVAVANLVRNALVHGRPAGGAAEVLVTVGATSVTVDDGGPGIAASDRERVLQRFERGNAVQPGSGLGLAIVRQVAIAHGGDVSVDASPAGGARVTMRLG